MRSAARDPLSSGAGLLPAFAGVRRPGSSFPRKGGIAYGIVIPEIAKRLSGTFKKKRLHLGGPGSEPVLGRAFGPTRGACFAGLRPG